MFNSQLLNYRRVPPKCTFSTSQLPKVVRDRQFRTALRHNGMQLFISHLARWLRTRRFSQHTCQPSSAINHWKNRGELRLSYLLAHLHFLLSLSLIWSSHFFSSLPWLFPPLLFHLSRLSEVWLLNFLRLSPGITAKMPISIMYSLWLYCTVQYTYLIAFTFAQESSRHFLFLLLQSDQYIPYHH